MQILKSTMKSEGVDVAGSEAVLEYERQLAAIESALAKRRLETYRPYPKQKEFHGIYARERLLAAGNQLGKTIAGSMEMAMHLTGLYPDWWEGRRFSKAIIAWGGSVTGVELVTRCSGWWLGGLDNLVQGLFR